MSAVPIRPPAQARPMTEVDLGEIMAIEQGAYDFPWAINVFRDCLAAGYGCWVLERNGYVIGYGVLSIGGDEAHVLNLCIAPEEQGQGMGRRLLRRLLDVARWHRVQRVFLEVRPSNPRALSLYQSEGFLRIGLRPRYYPARAGREDAVVMAIELRVQRANPLP